MPGESFRVCLSVISRQNEHPPDVILQEAVRAFWLLTHLGGVGTRSRRMAGAFRARYAKRPDVADFPLFSPQTPYEDWFQTQLAALDLNGDETSESAVDHLGRGRVWIGAKQYEYCSQGVDEVGTAYQEFRDSLSDGHKLGFGLPIGPGDDDVHVDRSGEKVERRASPLWMQFVEDGSGRYRTVFTLFEGPFLPDSHDVTVDGHPFGSVFRQRAADFVAEQMTSQVYSA